MSDAPSPFSAHNPKLQMVWDSTSLKQLMFCPRSYELSILEGWRGSAVDLEFGIFFASATETYKKARLAGASKHEAQLRALDQALTDSWDERADLPWGGTYEDEWRCTGTEPYKNSKGNKAKCPYSHTGKFFPAPSPGICGTCGSETETVRRYAPNHASKNRRTLIRLVAWYIEEQPDDLSEGLAPFAFPNGQPAVELSVKLPIPVFNSYGEQYILSGHLDSIMQFGTEKFVADNKTTGKFINDRYWQGFNPNIQVDLYDLMGNLLFPELELSGVAIEAASVTKDGATFGMRTFPKTEAQRQETLNTVEWWISQAERFAEQNHWPMATANCWNCGFASICSKDPSKREMYLKADFQRKRWNPLEER
jgi:hypothetical protein